MPVRTPRIVGPSPPSTRSGRGCRPETDADFAPAHLDDGGPVPGADFDDGGWAVGLAVLEEFRHREGEPMAAECLVPPWSRA